MKIQEELKIQIAEFSPFWENPEQNISFLEEIFSATPNADIILLPEMFNTGFSMNIRKITETMNGSTLKWMKEFSVRKKCAIAGSIPIYENTSCYNRFLFISEGKILSYYDKRHLFSYAGEDDYYRQGKETKSFLFEGWKIRPSICYDLRFPVWLRNTDNYDLLITVANWPQSRISIWDTLLKTRAIENMTYVCGINRIGTDGNDVSYNGNSALINPIGEIIPWEKKNTIVSEQIIDLKEIKKYRNRFKFLEDKDNFSIQI